MQTNKQTIYTFIIILIFGSGLAIFVWNKIQGRDLSQPPKFDLSAYDNYELGAELQKRAQKEFVPLVEKMVNQEDTSSVKGVEVVEVVKSEFESGYIYFRDSFRSTSVAETNELIESFLNDFPELKDVVVENFETQIKAQVEVPAFGREALLEKIKADPDVLSLEVMNAPIWEVMFKQGKTESELMNFFIKFDDIKIQPGEPQIKIEDYVARIRISDLDLDQIFIDKLQKEYSDVIKIVF